MALPGMDQRPVDGCTGAAHDALDMLWLRRIMRFSNGAEEDVLDLKQTVALSPTYLELNAA